MGKIAKMQRWGHFAALISLLSVSQAALVTQAAEEPNPRELLDGVAKARQQISSGEMEWEWFYYRFERPLDGTNHIKLKIRFDGAHRRIEAVSREYAYTLMGPAVQEVTDAKRAELGLDRAAALRAGLLEGFEARDVTTYDGSVLLRYREADGRSEGVRMQDPDAAKGSGTAIFDPRCLGLRTYMFVGWTIETCLSHKEAQSVDLIANESIDGIAAWHVRVKSGYGVLDYWIDTAQPARLIKHAYGADTVVSKFDAGNPKDAIPIEVRVSEYRNGKQRSEQRFIRKKARFNVPVDPKSWSLAGLGMPVGTPVSDDRISRHIGYWDGTAISKESPANAEHVGKPREKANPANLLALAERDPKSAFGLLAATWIIRNASERSTVDKAADIIRRQIEDATSSREVQAYACFALANHLKQVGNETGDKEMAAEAGRVYERILSKYGDLSADGKELADEAKRELSVPRVGAMAPEIEGADVEGAKFKLSDFRGKVVVLDFWGDW